MIEIDYKKWWEDEKKWIAKCKKLLSLKKEGRVLEKKCSRCGIVKPVEEFHKNRSNSIGIHHECKECANAFYNKYSKRKREEEIMETKDCDKTIADLETFIHKENVLITAEEKRIAKKEKRTAARKVILAKKENKLLKMREIVAKQVEKAKVVPLFNAIYGVDSPGDDSVIWGNEGIFNDVGEIKNEILQIFKKHSGDKSWGLLLSYKGVKGEELTNILEEFVLTHLLEKREDKKNNQVRYRYKTIEEYVCRNNAMVVNSEH